MKAGIAFAAALLVLLCSCGDGPGAKSPEPAGAPPPSAAGTPPEASGVSVPSVEPEETGAKAGTETSPETRLYNRLTKEEREYLDMCGRLVEETIGKMFGEESPDRVVKVLGEPYKKLEFDGFERWYFKQDVEVDVSSMGETLILENYIYLGPACELKTSRGIGIGSALDEVREAYKKEFNEQMSTDEYAVAGDRASGVVFLIKDALVRSIFIATGSYSPGELGNFTDGRDTSNFHVFWAEFRGAVMENDMEGIRRLSAEKLKVRSPYAEEPQFTFFNDQVGRLFELLLKEPAIVNITPYQRIYRMGTKYDQIECTERVKQIYIDENSAHVDSLIFGRVDGKWKLTGLVMDVESLKTLDVLRPY